MFAAPQHFLKCQRMREVLHFRVTPGQTKDLCAVPCQDITATADKNALSFL